MHQSSHAVCWRGGADRSKRRSLLGVLNVENLVRRYTDGIKFHILRFRHSLLTWNNTRIRRNEDGVVETGYEGNLYVGKKPNKRASEQESCWQGVRSCWYIIVTDDDSNCNSSSDDGLRRRCRRVVKTERRPARPGPARPDDRPATQLYRQNRLQVGDRKPSARPEASLPNASLAGLHSVM